MKQLILLLTVAALVGHSQAQGNRKCAANGEYCLTHNECCSGSCLSFSYKCVPVPPSAVTGSTFVPVTVDTGNRFGGPDDGGASLTQKTCALNGEYCQTHAECCSGSCLSFSYKCVPLSSGTSSSPPQRPASGTGTTNQQQGSTTVDLGNRVGEDQSTVAFTNVTPPPRKCAALGEYCLTSSECCSGSCLSFSYKCVTNHRIDVGQPQLSRPVGTTISGGLTNRFDGTSDASSTAPKKCAAVGEYCLTASDCCSLSCLSFSYKCVHNYDLGTQQLTSSGIPVQTGGSSNNGAIDTGNRFGGGSDKQCTSNGLYCFHNAECCSGACFKSFCSTQVNLGVPESELTRPSISNGPYVQVNSLDELITRFGGGGSQATGRDSSGSASANVLVGNRNGTGKKCAVVGEGCSRQEDCCSQRCHSYRRKCVT